MLNKNYITLVNLSVSYIIILELYDLIILMIKSTIMPFQLMFSQILSVNKFGTKIVLLFNYITRTDWSHRLFLLCYN